MGCRITHIVYHAPDCVQVDGYIFSYGTNIARFVPVEWKGKAYLSIANLSNYSKTTRSHQEMCIRVTNALVIHRGVPKDTVDLEVWWGNLTEEEKERVTKP